MTWERDDHGWGRVDSGVGDLPLDPPEDDDDGPDPDVDPMREEPDRDDEDDGPDPDATRRAHSVDVGAASPACWWCCRLLSSPIGCQFCQSLKEV